MVKHAKVLVNTELDWTILVKADGEEQLLYKLVNNSNLPTRHSAIGGTHHSRFDDPAFCFHFALLVITLQLLCDTNDWLVYLCYHMILSYNSSLYATYVPSSHSRRHKWCEQLEWNHIWIWKPWINAPTNKTKFRCSNNAELAADCDFSRCYSSLPRMQRMKQEYLNGFGKWAKSNT